MPLAGAELILATRDTWPVSKDLFCAELDSWPEEAEVIERVPVASCRRVGASVQLVLDRAQRRRSLFVWTSKRGRPLIFWRSERSMKSTRPGVRAPSARGLDGPLTLVVDARERYAWRFAGLPVTLEGRLSQLLKGDIRTRPGWLLNLVAALQAAYPNVPMLFAETGPLAADLAYRWLSASLRLSRAQAVGRTVGETLSEALGSGTGAPPTRSTLPTPRQQTSVVRHLRWRRRLCVRRRSSPPPSSSRWAGARRPWTAPAASATHWRGRMPARPSPSRTTPIGTA